MSRAQAMRPLRALQALPVLLTALAASSAVAGQTAAPAEDLLPGLPAPVEFLASSLDLGSLHIALQATSLQLAQQQLGGRIAQQGQAGVATRSLCYYQAHGKLPWVLWLDSSELYHGDVIHGFRLARLSPDATLTAGCSALPAHTDAVLAAPVRLGEPHDEVVAALGPPATETPGTLLFLRARSIERDGLPFTLTSRVFIRLHDGQVEYIEAQKSTSIE